MDTSKGKVDHVTRFEGRPKSRERYPSRFDPKSHFAYKMGVCGRSMLSLYLSFLHYLLVTRTHNKEKINTLRGIWLPVYPILIMSGTQYLRDW